MQAAIVLSGRHGNARSGEVPRAQSPYGIAVDGHLRSVRWDAGERAIGRCFPYRFMNVEPAYDKGRRDMLRPPQAYPLVAMITAGR